jgi:pimeloyl-ACP methyl ester carboxylesterase
MRASELHVDDSGAGEPVLLLHSSGLSGRQWRRLVPELVKRGMRAVSPDLTGHGQSDAWPEPTPFSFRIDVERVQEILHGLGAAHVVGHSYGGLVALHAAIAAPSAIRSLNLYEPVAFGVLDSSEDDDARATLRGVEMHWGATSLEHERWLGGFVDYWGGPGAWSALREEARAEFRRVGWVLREGVRTLTEDTTRASTFAALETPMHLFAGERSPIASRRVVQRLGEAVRHALITSIAGIGHLGPVANTDVVNPLLIDALTTERGRSASDDDRFA